MSEAQKQETCSHQCEHCSKECKERTKKSLLIEPHPGTHIKHVIGVVSGKGGVGKSMVTSLLAVMANRAGYRTAILDADITGPSIPQSFGLHSHADGDSKGLKPVTTKEGISVMSINLLTEKETAPVVWRGPVISGVVKQFWKDVIWGDLDYLFIDMPPGTGDVPLTVFQTVPVDGIVIVTSPQELVSMIVEKAVNMVRMMNIPVLGLVENMSYVTCPDCGRKIHIFGESHIEATAKVHKIGSTARLPIDTRLAAACDEGSIEQFQGDWLDQLFQDILQKTKTKPAP